MRHVIIITLCLLATACQKFDAPPQGEIIGIADGVLSDPTAPLVLGFHEKFDPTTLHVRIVEFVTDAEGQLADEQEPPVAFNSFFEDPGPDGEAVGGVATIDESGRFYSMALTQTLPIGPPLALIIEPGLKDLAGNEWKVRQVLKFGFEFNCGGDDADPKPSVFPDATHFMLVAVDKPVQAQLQLMAVMQVDPETGDVNGQFTNGDRDKAIDCAQFGLTCASNEVCRTIPAPACVLPSEEGGSPDEYPDFIANNVKPEGYSFTVLGCVQDQEDGTFTFANAPVDVKVESPPITVKGISFNGSFGYDTAGVLRASGTFTAQEIFLGTTASGTAAGTIVMREIPPDEIKPGTPQPPPVAEE